MRKVLPILLLAGCAFRISGASAPTDETVRLTPADIAAAESDVCVQDWVGPHPGPNRAKALSLLDDRGVVVIERRVLRRTTAYARRLRVGKDFWKRPLAEQSAILSHELVHYCQRDLLGDEQFVVDYGDSVGRWRLEVPAYAQTIRTMILQGDGKWVDGYIDDRIPRMRNFYLLWNIDPAQYETETRRIWEAVPR